VTVAVLLRYQHPVNCNRSNVEDVFTYTVNYLDCVHRPGLKYMQLLESVEGLLLKNEEIVEF